MTIRVLVADDQALVRVGFCGIIAATPGLSVVGEAATGAEAVEMARATRPDIVLMDVRMPVMDGIEATRLITAGARTADVRVLILTTFDLDEYVYAALRAGASGFLLKDTMPADLLNAIRVIAAGDALLAPSVTRRLLGEFASRPELSPPQIPAGPGAAQGPDRTGAGGAHAGGPGAVERRDRREAEHQPGDSQDPRRAPADQAGLPRSRPAGHHRLPGRARPRIGRRQCA